MNWKLLFKLSMFGLVMAIATVFWVSSSIEPLIWLVIFLMCAMIIVQQVDKKHFLHGFVLSLFNCVWITTVHVLLFDIYLENHPEMTEMMRGTFMFDHPRRTMLITGPVIGIVSGVVQGLFCWVGFKIKSNNFSNNKSAASNEN